MNMRTRLTFAIVILIFVSVIGCKEKQKANDQSLSPAQETEINTDKFDSELRIALLDDSVATVVIFGKCDKPITEDMEAALRETGLDVQTITGELFTARCEKKVVWEIAKIDFVQHLQLTRKLKPLENETPAKGEDE